MIKYESFKIKIESADVEQRVKELVDAAAEAIANAVEKYVAELSSQGPMQKVGGKLDNWGRNFLSGRASGSQPKELGSQPTRGDTLKHRFGGLKNKVKDILGFKMKESGIIDSNDVFQDVKKFLSENGIKDLYLNEAGSSGSLGDSIKDVLSGFVDAVRGKKSKQETESQPETSGRTKLIVKQFLQDLAKEKDIKDPRTLATRLKGLYKLGVQEGGNSFQGMEMKVIEAMRKLTNLNNPNRVSPQFFFDMANELEQDGFFKDPEPQVAPAESPQFIFDKVKEVLDKSSPKTQFDNLNSALGRDDSEASHESTYLDVMRMLRAFRQPVQDVTTSPKTGKRKGKVSRVLTTPSGIKYLIFQGEKNGTFTKEFKDAINRIETEELGREPKPMAAKDVPPVPGAGHPGPIVPKPEIEPSVPPKPEVPPQTPPRMEPPAPKPPIEPVKPQPQPDPQPQPQVEPEPQQRVEPSRTGRQWNNVDFYRNKIMNPSKHQSERVQMIIDLYKNNINPYEILKMNPKLQMDIYSALKLMGKNRAALRVFSHY
jgi:hypothetical protein